VRSNARVVIVGGGVMGIALQYHLALEGWTDTVLVEKSELTSGSTWHAAGQCPSFIANFTMAKVHAHGNDLYARLEAMTGMPTGWHASGGIRFATTREELDHFRRVEGVAANIGFRMQVIGPDEIRRINPFVTTTGVLAGAWTLDDGYVDPSSACNAMAFAARELGATLVLGGQVPPPRVMDLLARWLRLAEQRTEADGWTAESEGPPRNWNQIIPSAPSWLTLPLRLVDLGGPGPATRPEPHPAKD
jgi:dimethylglycine dehydrogenase